MGQAARKNWADRALAKVSQEAIAEVSKMSALAAAPVKPAPYYPPIPTAGAPVIRVSVEWVNVAPTGESWEKHGPLAEFHEDHSNRANDKAALRNNLTEAHEWGDRPVRAVILLLVGGLTRTVIAEGTVAAIRRAFPDKDALQTWKDAGALEVPVWGLEDAANDARRVTWVPIDQAPVVLQMEYEGRDRAIAREKLAQYDERAEIAAALYKGQLL